MDPVKRGATFSAALVAFGLLSAAAPRSDAQAVAQVSAAPTATPPQSGAAPGTGGRLGGARGAGPTMKPSALRAVPAETTAAKVVDPNWKAPRTPWGHPDLEGAWSTDDMRGIPTSRPGNQGTRDSLTPEEFARRAAGDEAGRDRAVNQETILRNEFGIRTFGYSSFVIEPSNGQLPAITAEAAARRKAVAGVGTFGNRAFNTFEDFTMYDRCITRGVGAIFPAIYGNGIQIAQSPTEVFINYEMIHDSRVIPLDGRPHIASSIKQFMGDPRGHWKGDTLVVESTNFTDRTSILGLHSDRLKLTEWFTRVDPQMIEYRIRVDDPATYAAPFTARLMITQQPNYAVYEYACHEGNTAVGHALSGERAYERLVEEAKAKGLPIPPRTMGMEVYSGAPVEGREPVREFGVSPR